MTPAADPGRSPQLTYDTATPEQIAEARAEARRKLAEADQRRTPEQIQRGRELLGLDQDQPAA